VTVALPLSGVPPLRRRAGWLLVAIHVPFIAFTIMQGGLGLAMPRMTQYDGIAIALAIAAGAIQLRHSLAVAEGVRPRYWMWTLLLLVLIVALPIPTFRDRWITLQWFVVASFAMLLPVRLALVAIATVALTSGLWYARVLLLPDASVGERAWNFWYREA